VSCRVSGSLRINEDLEGQTPEMVEKWQLSGVVVRMSDLRLEVVGSNPGHDITGYFLR